MSELRELTDAELDIVGGGVTRPMRPPVPGGPSLGGGGAIGLVEEVIVDILKILEPQKPNRAVPYN